jgi:DNA invertase Pin-like site-specific DNA recombinase
VHATKCSVQPRVRQILGAVSQFEKAQLVRKLRAARERKRAETGRCEGRNPVPSRLAEAKRLARRSPKTGQRRSLRAIAAELARLGHLGPSGKPYGAESVKRMVAT